MSDKKMMQWLVELPFPEDDISCKNCKLMTKSCVTYSMCRLTGSKVDLKSDRRNTDCPLRAVE